MPYFLFSSFDRPALADGWFQFGSNLYKFFAERRTWEQARQFCQADEGELVTIESERENQFVFEMFAKDKTNANAPGSNYLPICFHTNISFGLKMFFLLILSLLLSLSFNDRRFDTYNCLCNV